MMLWYGELFARWKRNISYSWWLYFTKTCRNKMFCHSTPKDSPLCVTDRPFSILAVKGRCLTGRFLGVWLECDDSHCLFPEKITFLKLQDALWTTLPRLRLWYALKMSPSTLSHLHNRHSFKGAQVRQKVQWGTSDKLEQLMYLMRHTGWIVRLHYGIGELLLVVFPKCSSV